MKKKLAIILSGGGMTCSYSAGFMNALATEYGFTEPDIIISGSGSAGTAAYYISGQYDCIKSIWENRLSGSRFINKFRFWRIIDIDYLVDEVFKKLEPLDVERVYNSKIKLYIPSTNTETGEMEYFQNNKNVDLFEAMRASKAMPILFGKRIKIGEKTFYDSAISSSANLHIKKAVELGATHILVVTNNNPGAVAKFVYKLWVKSKPKKFKDNYYKLEKELQSKIDFQEAKVFWIKPKYELPVKALTSKQKLLEKSIHFGCEDCKASKGLKVFLDSYKEKLKQ